MEVAWSEPQRDEALAERQVQCLSRQNEEAAVQAEGGMLGTLRRMSISLVQPSMSHMAEQAQDALRQVMGSAAWHVEAATPAAEPRLAMLCVETLLKSLYFCKLAYRLEVCGRVSGGGEPRGGLQVAFRVKRTGSLRYQRFAPRPQMLDAPPLAHIPSRPALAGMPRRPPTRP